VSDEVVYEGTASELSVCELEKIILLRKTCRLLAPPPLYSHSPSSVKNEATKAGKSATKEPRSHYYCCGDKEETGGRLSRLQICASVRRA